MAVLWPRPQAHPRGCESLHGSILPVASCPPHVRHRQSGHDIRGHAIGIPSCLFAGAMACLRLSSDYFILQYFVGDRLFSKMPFSRRHLAFPGMPSFFFLFSEYSFSGVRWQCSNPLNLTFIKDWERVKTTPFYSVLYSAFVIYKETTATELSYFYLCFIFNFSNIKS